jgi:hypothetical protein
VEDATASVWFRLMKSCLELKEQTTERSFGNDR